MARHAVFWSDEGSKTLYKNHVKCGNRGMSHRGIIGLWLLDVLAATRRRPAFAIASHFKSFF